MGLKFWMLLAMGFIHPSFTSETAARTTVYKIHFLEWLESEG